MAADQAAIEVRDGTPKEPPFCKIEDAILTDYPAMTPTILAVYVALKTFTHESGRPCFPSVKTIAELAHVSEDSVSRATAALVGFGLLAIEAQYRINEDASGKKQPRRTVNLYTLYAPSHPCPTYNPHKADHRSITRTERPPLPAQSGSNNESNSRTRVNSVANATLRGALTGTGKTPSLPKQPKRETIPVNYPHGRPEKVIWAMVDAYAHGKGVDLQDVSDKTRHQAFELLKNVPKWTTAEDIEACTRYLRSDPWYETPGRLTVSKVVDTLADWHRDGKPDSIGVNTAIKYSGKEQPELTTEEDQERRKERRATIERMMRGELTPEEEAARQQRLEKIRRKSEEAKARTENAWR